MSKRTIDFKYAPWRSQCSIGLIDDYFKTIVEEDGSISFDYSWPEDVHCFHRNDDRITPVHSRRIQNYGFRYRYKPEVFGAGKYLERKQTYAPAKQAIVYTNESYEKANIEYTSFAWRTESDARIDVIKYKMKVDGTIDIHTLEPVVKLLALGDEPPLDPISYEKTDIYVTGLKHIENHQIKQVKSKLIKENTEGKKYYVGAFFIIYEGDIDEKDLNYELAESALEWCKSYWENSQLFKKEMTIPDESIMDMIKACARNIFQAREIRNHIPTFQVGPTRYRNLWVVDGHFMQESGHILGWKEESFAGIYSLLRHVHPDGSIYMIDDHDKETAIAIATIIRQCELIKDDERLIELWPTILRAVDYIRSQRDKTYTLGEDYPGKGLFPPCFGDGGINEEAEYTTVFWTLYGLKAAMTTGERLKLKGTSDISKLYKEVMDVYLDASKRDMKVTEDGIPYLPQSMVSVEEQLERILSENGLSELVNPEIYKPQTGIWAMCHTIANGQVFEDNDPLVTNLLRLLDSIDDKQGIPASTGWMTHQGIWPYGSMFDAHVWLYAGQGQKAADYLYAFANHASPARVWREEQPMEGTNTYELCGDMPHNWASSMFIILVRNLLAFEKVNSLELLSGMPEEWLPKKGKDLVLEKSPTKFGDISLRMSLVSKGNYTLSIELENEHLPVEFMYLTWPGEITESDIDEDGSNKVNAKLISKYGDNRYKLNMDNNHSLKLNLKL